MDEIETIAARHHLPLEAAQHLRDALARGHGEMAQFNHPALGGMGQWHRGGMLMIGDMFNDDLKARVGACLRDLAERAPPAATAADTTSSSSGEWPREFGAPSSSGSQNGARYAFFAKSKRLVIVGGENAGTYDTGDQTISGASQQQGSSSDLAFSSQHGPVRLSDLKKVEAPSRSASKEDAPVQRETPARHAEATRTASEPSGPEHAASTHAASSPSTGHRDDFATLERLSELHRKQILTDEEYKTKKAEILARF